MFDPGNPVVWLVGVILLAAVAILVRNHFGAEARERRRRDRSHGPVISRKRGPAIRLAVDMDDRKRKRQR